MTNEDQLKKQASCTHIWATIFKKPGMDSPDQTPNRSGLICRLCELQVPGKGIALWQPNEQAPDLTEHDKDVRMSELEQIDAWAKTNFPGNVYLAYADTELAAHLQARLKELCNHNADINTNTDPPTCGRCGAEAKA